MLLIDFFPINLTNTIYEARCCADNLYQQKACEKSFMTVVICRKQRFFHVRNLFVMSFFSLLSRFAINTISHLACVAQLCRKFEFNCYRETWLSIWLVDIKLLPVTHEMSRELWSLNVGGRWQLELCHPWENIINSLFFLQNLFHFLIF